ncbi:MFS transporter [Streptomyces yaizuensis]|uniref:MFS transporter n=1 Tax=Streptomyces yaizuensis TaxID=2989713 RepID=A0ABQ5P4U4_9ACTN|nr:MFS transporter [Streptomyces sp. YSPA8]GLF97621.1 MFS transporter [Streptomyces sp. YSPA8]
MDGRTRDTRWLLSAVLVVQFLVALDMSVVNVALPDMRDDLGFTPGGLQWVVGAYALGFGGLLMLGGRLADLVGGRRLLPAGLVLFGVASLIGGVVSTPGALIAARALQGVGAAAISPVALALITLSFPEGPARSRALGLWGMAGAAGGAVGVLAGGLLTDAAGWRAVMLVNVPIVLFALFAAGRARLPGPRDTVVPGLDIAGALLVTAGMSLLVLGVVRTESHPWGSAQALLPLGAAALLLTAFVLVERRTPRPLLRLGLLAVRPVLGANLFTLLICSGQFASFYFCSLYMQQVLGYGAGATGAAFLPFSAGVVAGSLIATRVVARTGTRALLTLGGLTGAAGLAWYALAATPDGTFLTAILGPSLVASVGIGMSFVPLGTAAVTGVAPGEAGMASGLLSSSRQIGGSLGLAALVTAAASVTGDRTDPAALAEGHRLAYGVGAGLLALGAALAFALLPGRTDTDRVAGAEESRKNSGGDVDPEVSRSTQR